MIHITYVLAYLSFFPNLSCPSISQFSFCCFVFLVCRLTLTFTLPHLPFIFPFIYSWEGNSIHVFVSLFLIIICPLLPPPSPRSCHSWIVRRCLKTWCKLVGRFDNLTFTSNWRDELVSCFFSHLEGTSAMSNCEVTVWSWCWWLMFNFYELKRTPFNFPSNFLSFTMVIILSPSKSCLFHFNFSCCW